MSTLRDHLNAIRQERGRLDREVVVEVASDPEHPLHNRFDWNDSVAAHKWRLEQAGQLLRVTFKPDPDKPVNLRSFVAIKGEESNTSEYVPTEEVAVDEFAAQLLLKQMKRDWETFKRRYEHMAEFIAFVQDQVTDGAA